MRFDGARPFGLVAALMLLSGCGNFDAVRPTSRMELLEPTSAFQQHVAPFANADIPNGAQIPVVGEVVRDGRTLRVVKLPDDAVRGFFITVDDDGRMIDSVNAFNGRRLDLSPPDPPDVRLISRRQAQGSASSPADAIKSQVDSAPGVSEHASANWLTVPCDIVVASARGECLSQHRSAGIPDNKITATADTGGDDSLIQQADDSLADEVGPPVENPPLERVTATLDQDQPSARSCYATSGYRPAIDTQGVDVGQLECDLEECQAYAAQVSPARSAVSNAIGGAIFGALIGLAVGDHGWAARAGAQGGAIGGALGGAGGAVVAQTNIVRNCMAGRGYRVLQ